MNLKKYVVILLLILIIVVSIYFIIKLQQSKIKPEIKNVIEEENVVDINIKNEKDINLQIEEELLNTDKNNNQEEQKFNSQKNLKNPVKINENNEYNQNKNTKNNTFTDVEKQIENKSEPVLDMQINYNPKDFEVPVNYKTQNIQKYIYTPKGFKN